MNIPKEKLIGGYGIEITDWSKLEGFIQETCSEEVLWDWAWDQLHHQGDVGSATYYFAIELGRHLLNKSTISSDYLSILLCLGFQTKIHDNIDRYVNEFKLIRKQYILHSVTNVSSMDKLESVKILCAVIAQESKCKILAEYLDIVDSNDIKKYVESEMG